MPRLSRSGARLAVAAGPGTAAAFAAATAAGGKGPGVGPQVSADVDAIRRALHGRLRKMTVRTQNSNLYLPG